MLVGSDYDNQWNVLGDYIRFHPGARHRRRLSLDLIKSIDFSSVLDVGCGVGEMLLLLRGELAGKEISFHGADFAEQTISSLKDRIDWAEFSVLDIEKDALDKQFDLVICSEVIEHLNDRESAFRHLSRMLAPGGHLLITCPTGKIHATEKHWGHVSHPSVQELEQRAQENGLQIEALLNWGWPAYKALKYATNVNSDWAIKEFW